MPQRKLGFSALLKAVYTRLTTHANTSGYSTYDHVPRNTAMPYISIGKPVGGRSPNFGTRDTAAEDNIIVVDIFSRYKGNKECADMMNNVVIALESAALTITGYNDPMLALMESSDIIEDDSDPGKLVYHGVIRYSFQMSQS